MKPLAYRHLALTPREFFSFTFDEFEEMLDGWLWRRQKQEEDLAVLQCAIFNSAGKSLKKAVKPSDFISRPDEKEKPSEDDAEYLIREFGIPPEHLKKGGRR